jgi:hypothetical protein
MCEHLPVLLIHDRDLRVLTSEGELIVELHIDPRPDLPAHN